jgi:hypothetical protein
VSSWWEASSMMAQEGRKLWRLRRRWSLAAALRRRCLAQFMQLARSEMVEESMAWTVALKRRGSPL